MVQRLIRGQPPSPPQSTDGDLPSDVGQITDMYSMYGGQTAAPYGGSGSENDVSFDQQSSLAIDIQYAGPTSDCSQNTSLHNQLVTDKMRVHTPPADDGAASRNSEPPRWPSPSMIPSGISKPRVLRSPRQRRRTKGRKDSMEQGARLTAPLSVLTKDMTHIPLKDMEQHVNRPTEERLAETVRKHGKIPRPMNSFMLYRSAYAERTKELFRQQNHQVVSTAAGQSWNNETPEIKLQYERYAAIEKKNHLKAHPGYKFTPAKDKKKRMLDDDRSYIAGYRTTPEASPAQRHISRFSAFSSPDLGSNGWDSGHPTPPDMGHHGLQTDGYFPQSWPTSHPGKSTSGLMLTSDPTQYLQPSSNPDDMHYASSTTLAGLPGAAHHDLLQPQIPTSGSGAGGQLDPQLLDFNEGGNQVYGGSQYPPLWQSESSNNVYFQYPTSPIGFAGASPLQPGVQTLDGRDTWDPSQAAGMEPVGGEFDHWINNPQGY